MSSELSTLEDGQGVQYLGTAADCHRRWVEGMTPEERSSYELALAGKVGDSMGFSEEEMAFIFPSSGMSSLFPAGFWPPSIEAERHDDAGSPETL